MQIYFLYSKNWQKINRAFLLLFENTYACNFKLEYDDIENRIYK